MDMMWAQERCPMKDVLLKEYELNEKYHDSKENRIWLACGLYFTYSVATMSWILNPVQNGFAREDAWPLGLTMLLIDISSFIFLFLQAKRKADSVKRTGRIKRAFRDLRQDAEGRFLVETIWKGEIATNSNLKGDYRNWIGLYWTEVPLLFIVAMLVLAKAYLFATRLLIKAGLAPAVNSLGLLICCLLALLLGVVLGILIMERCHHRSYREPDA
jgi:hypothetical protein